MQFLRRKEAFEAQIFCKTPLIVAHIVSIKYSLHTDLENMIGSSQNNIKI